MSGGTIEQTLVEPGTRLRLEAGDTLFAEGDEPRGIYILESGVVDLLFSSRGGTSKPLRVAQAGRILGLSAVVSDRRHDCTAMARAASRVGFIEKNDFLRMLDETPTIWAIVLRLLSEDVTDVYDDMRALVH